MPTNEPTRRPPSTFLLDHGSIGYQCLQSAIEDRWVEVVIEDDEVEVTLISTPAKMLAMGLTIAAMAASRDHQRTSRRLDRIEQMVEEILLAVQAREEGGR